MLSRDDAYAQVKVLEQHASGRATDAEAEAALRRLGEIRQVSVVENVRRYRTDMKMKRPVSGCDREYWLIRHAGGIRQALGSFVYADQEEPDD